MPDVTPIRAYPFPLDTDPVSDMADAMHQLALALDTRLAVGAVSVGVSAASSGTQAVVFPAGRFTIAPRVFVSAGVSSTLWVPFASAVTTTGFTATVRNIDGASGSPNITVAWMAIQFKPTATDG